VLVYADQFEEELRDSTPVGRARQIDPFTRRQRLDNMIQFELMLREARKLGLEQDDEVQRQKKKSMVNRLMGHVLDKDPRVKNLTDDDLKAFYQAHLDDYVKPERLRLQLIEYKRPPDAIRVPPEALKDFAALGSHADEPSTFSALAKAHSDDEGSRASGGDTGWMTREELEKKYGPAVVAAAGAK